MHGRHWWHGRFKNHGFRLTQPRELVIEILHGTEEHLSASEVYIKCHEKNPSIGLTTVYRTLDMLVQMGIVQKFDFGDGFARFELINDPEGKGHHHHLVCLSCKRIIDYSDMMDEEKIFLDKIEAQLEKKYKFTINDHVIRFQGYCETCSNQNNDYS